MSAWADTTDIAPLTRPAGARRFPLLLLYALAVATFGLYPLVWIRRVARDHGEGEPHPRTPTWWALGSICPPICSLVLYALASRAREDGRALGVGKGMAPLVPALLYAAVVLALLATPLKGLLAPLLILAPIPFLLVQRMLNRNWMAASESVADSPRRIPGWPEGVALLTGLPLVIAVIWFHDRQALPNLLQRPFDAGQVVTGDSAGYRLSIPGPGWRRVAAGTLGDPDSDLELSGPEAGTWVVVRATQGGGATVDGLVDARRQLVFGSADVRAYEDRRRFLPGEDPVVASLATYRIGSTLVGQGVFVILSTVGPTGSFEVIGFSQNGDRREAELSQLVESFGLERLAPPGP